MSYIDNKEIQQKYNNIDNIWSTDDTWHIYTFKKIAKFIGYQIKKINVKDDFSLLNAGSAGNEYGINCERHIHLDLIDKHIINKPHYLIGSIEEIPLEDSEIDLILCVGSVINYTDAVSSIKEFNRILNSKGYLILEFENSYSLEYVLTDSFKKTADIVTTFYKNREEKIWIYSHEFIRNLLELHNFKIIKIENFHILSPLIYKLTKNENFASKFTIFDNFLSKINFIKNYSSNIILICQKV